MQFRKDINGLRTYAVLAVIFFHFNKEWLPGGFVGVDIFFVISGYLMTSIIFRGLSNQNFSILKFYSARVRRIIPALFTLILLLIILGYFFLGPLSYRELSKESIRSLLFISNFLYWKASAGYFDTEALSKPLLHTWSLSVEWQFYLLYPAVLLVFAKFLSQKFLKPIIIMMATVSLIFSIYLSPISPSTAYFLLPTRIWQMLLGGLIFLYPLRITHKPHQVTLEIIGFLLIIVSLFIISENTSWPGYMALLPTIGAYLLIQSQNNSFLTNNIVCQKIGLWSYSLYLYHWPILFINYRYNLQINVITFLCITFALSLASYYVIEHRQWKVKYILISVFVALIPIYGIYKTKGASFRVVDQYHLTAEEFQQLYYGGGDFPAYQVAYTNANEATSFDYIMLGDSYARQYTKYLLNNNIHTKTWYADACLFTQDYYVYLDKKILKNCTDFANSFYQYIDKTKEHQPIVWIQSWDGYHLALKNAQSNLIDFRSNKAQKQYIIALEQIIQQMAENNPQRNIYLIGVYTRPNYNIYECLSERELNSFSESCPEFIPQTNNLINEQLITITEQYSNVYFIDPNKGLCSDQGCRMLINNEPMFSDMGHLSTYGANIVGKYIFDIIKKMESKNKNDY
ncbi:acyltransferase family protein [Wohlfahrtiimonas larvae]|uniref:Acyltransferase n=1 Tax=Wohlfahrtiimonas larvae TaxID=1157986 RepID=A0ABP9MFD3_9GAMM|nr:acyltransferase family protein [Wohlfahrtiimonas larvae]